jgi:hypothetical protein
MIHVFIDTNIYLNFFHFTNDELNELDKLRVAIEEGHLRLYMTKQVVREFSRNRDAKLAESLKEVQGMKVPDRFPRLVQSYGEYPALRQAASDFAKQRSALLEKVEADAAARTLAADHKFQDLTEAATFLDDAGDVLEAARARLERGDPPGKQGSLGDALNWEALLAGVPKAEDLAVLTDDQDFVSKLDRKRLSSFLVAEWQETKGAAASLYPDLTSFFKENFPDIELATEMAKELAIQDLITSGSFASTHAAIARLLREADFSDEQVQNIVTGALNNDQVYLIGRDQDVHDFFNRLMSGRRDLFSEETLAEFDGYFGSVWDVDASYFPRK